MIKKITIATLFISAMTGVLIWADWREKQVMSAMDRYDRCVEQTYHRTTWQLYRENAGNLPFCDFNKINEK